MSGPHQDIVALETGLPALKDQYERGLKAFLAIPQEEGNREARRESLQGWHGAGLNYFNAFERLISLGSLTGADRDATWYTEKAETAANLLGTIELHYRTLFVKAGELEMPRDIFAPSPTAFAGMQRLVETTHPAIARTLREKCIATGLPTVGFDTKASKKGEIGAIGPRADVLLITVNEHETEAVLAGFEAASGAKAREFPVDDRLYRCLGELSGTSVYHAISEMGSGGPGGMQQTVDKAIRALRPGAVIAVGVAFGVNEKKQAIGEVLISKQILLYELQRAGEVIKLRGDKPHASTWLINYFEGLKYGWTEGRTRSGLILSGEKLIDNIDYRDQLLALESESIGGEMEGAGLYVASHDHKVDWIVIKAICDWADGNKGKNKTRRQRKAASLACQFLIQALQRAPLKKQ